MIPISLEGRVALVTGGSRGIGRGIALALAKAGAQVAICYRRDAEAAEETLSLLRKHGRAEGYVASVDKWEDDQALIAKVVEDFGSLSILVNNAGMSSRGKLVADQDPEEIHKVLGLNALAPFYLSTLAIPHLRKCPRGDIIMVSSTITKTLPARTGPYSLSKAGLTALATVIAKEEAHNNIRCNVISPGLTVTDMGRRMAKARLGADDIHELDASFPFGHVCTVEEVGQLAAYLVSDANGYTSGQNLYIDGGVDQPT